jgi:hypothetical protein
MAVEVAASDGVNNETANPVTRTSPLSTKQNGFHEGRRTSGSSVREQRLSSSPDSDIFASEPFQLPSPDPSSSPRSPPPSSTMTDFQSVDWSRHNGFATRIRSGSSEPKTEEGAEKTSVESLTSPKPIPKRRLSHELHNIPEESDRKPRRPSITNSKSLVDEKVLKLSASQIEELTEAPESLPLPLGVRPSSPEVKILGPSTQLNGTFDGPRSPVVVEVARETPSASLKGQRPATSRAASTPHARRQDSGWSQADAIQPTPSRNTPYRQRGTFGTEGGSDRLNLRPEAINLNMMPTSPAMVSSMRSPMAPRASALPSPLPQDIPLPPMSFPTYLQLELASSRPSPLYIHRTAASEYPYELSRIKFERLLNFLLLPPQLEQVLGFGSLACLDAWLHTFTILPLRFVKAVAILIQWWCMVLATEARFIAGFTYHGAGRMWNRQRGRSDSTDSTPASRSASRSGRPLSSTRASYQVPKTTETRAPNGNAETTRIEMDRNYKSVWGRRHRRTKSQPSTLSSYHKADLLQGLVIICSCTILMYFDASRMYHSIRGQSAVKLYMIWNVLEVRIV